MDISGIMESRALLPVGTVVRIRGNNRTKQELSGCQGQVVTAAPLGGWHSVSVVDKNGKKSMIRVQRNALQVEAVRKSEQLPTSPILSPSIPCRVMETSRSSSTASQSCLCGGKHPATVPCTSAEIHGAPNRVIQHTFVTKHTTPGPNLGKLRYGTLRKYRRAFGLRIGKTHTKQQLAGLVSSHFQTWNVKDEVGALQAFLGALERDATSPAPHTRKPAFALIQTDF
uniref:Histone deacetylase complex subunit SAP30 Sin3 binding domain-containing protein n=1 Tax=Timspurckia oligopyrenoides TaxID=708627 RepID=A0A6T6NP23_9RHOD|mmetsp:Transcript_3860/g.6744  ORF Transcript_3860/g.6744 Transcript_3860/m.6744 type:complete len:227 (+) Transcript_3860:198-878(+)|eukprot:CAMPEP_0182442164 /NCGR_PEP_ID=MMETSP1172-20130603/1112_1 /TAXON_ID=708627 /ORGANISM="Timspurckia oligopyrenoides, Strain CCMP3278" /LENGTH=226 /DNA_ID=CAMNT_0024636879 /DNA_START=314 /DNA_END=994 /DNA_ORIENTATION=+